MEVSFVQKKNLWKVVLWLMMHDLQNVFERTEVLLNLFQQI